jgi:hypothetical protein
LRRSADRTSRPGPSERRNLKGGPESAELTVEVTEDLNTGRWRGTVVPCRFAGRDDQAEHVAQDQGDVILGWLSRVVVTIILVTCVGFDGLSIGVAHVSTKDDANTAAVAASQAWLTNPTSSTRGAATLAAADEVISQHGETLVPGSLVVSANGTVQLELRHQATTVLVHRLGPLRSWAEITVHGHGLYVEAP